MRTGIETFSTDLGSLRRSIVSCDTSAWSMAASRRPLASVNVLTDGPLPARSLLHRLAQIRDEVDRRLDADRQPHEVGGNGGVRALDRLVRHRLRDLDE